MEVKTKKELKSNIMSGSGDRNRTNYNDKEETLEKDSRFIGKRGSLRYSNMGSTDPIVGAILSSYKNPILSLKWELGKLEDKTKEEEKAIEVIENWFFVENDFEELLSSILSMLQYGFSTFEVYYVEFIFKDKLYMMPKFKFLTQDSIKFISYKKETVLQENINDQKDIEIPLKDLLFFSFNKVGADLRGVSLLRTSYDTFKIKEHLKKAMRVGIQRSATGIPIGTVPKGLDNESNHFKAFEDIIKKIAEVDTTEAYALLPEGYNFDFRTINYDATKVKDVLQYLDSSMLKATLTQFLALGQSGSGGSYSLSKDQTNIFKDGLGHIVDYISQKLSTILKTTLDFNFNIKNDNINFSSTGLNKGEDLIKVQEIIELFKSGILTKTDADELEIRKILNFNQDGPINKKANKPIEKTLKLSDNKVYSTRSQREKTIDKMINEATNSFITNSKIYSQGLLNSIKKATKGNKFLPIEKKSLSLPSTKKIRKELENQLSSYLLSAFESVKLKDQKKRKVLKLSESLEVKDIKDKKSKIFVKEQSRVVVEDHFNKLNEISLLAYNNAIMNNYSSDQSIAEVQNKLTEENKTSKVENGIFLSVVKSVNYGEQSFYNQIKVDLWGYEFMNRDPETDLCKSLQYKTYTIDSLQLAEITPPLHFRCKSFLAPIYKGEEPKGKLTPDNYIPAPSNMKNKNV